MPGILDFSSSDIQQLAALSGMSQNDLNTLKKSLTVSSGFVGYNLEAVAKWMMPFFHGVRKRLPTSTPKVGGSSAVYRAQLGESNFSYGGFGTAAGAIGPDALSGATSFTVPYQTQAVSGSVQVEAIHQSLGWDNAPELETKSALTRLFKFEEYENVGGNSAALAMTTVTANPSSLHLGPTFSNATWSIAVTALTLEGCVANGAVNSNVGETPLGTAYVDVVAGASGADYIDVSWPEVPGAFGYKVYANHAGGGGHGAAALYLVPVASLNYSNLVSGSYLTTLGTAIAPVPATANFVTVNHVQIAAVPANTQPNPPAADGTANANMYEGIMAWATKPTVYGVALPYRSVIDQGGATLTTVTGGIKEFDLVLQNLWRDQHASPSLILCSTNSILSLTNRVLAAGSNSQFRLDVYQTRNGIAGGLYVNGYVNKFAADMINMRKTIDVWAHPYVPDGTFIFITEDIPPETLPYANVAKTFELDTLIPYSYFPLASTTRTYPFSVYVNQALKCYWPSAQAAIVGARVDS